MANKTAQNKRFWEFKNMSDTSADLYIYGEISDYSWWEDVVTPKQFADDLQEVKNVDILNVRINSVGGDVFAAHAIYSLLKSCKAEVIVYIDGLAASAATIIMMAGDKICMPPNAMIMIHNPWTYARGSAKDLEKSIEVLEKVKDSIILAYQAKTGLDKEELSQLMDEETWMTGQEAFDRGFIDELIENVQVAASIKDESIFVNGIQFGFSEFKNKENLLNKFDFKDKTEPQNKELHLENLVDQFAKGVKDLFKTSNSKGARIDRAKEQMNELRTTLNSFGSKKPEILNELFEEIFVDFLKKEEIGLNNTSSNNVVTDPVVVVENKVEEPVIVNSITEEKVLELITNEIEKAKTEITNSLQTTVVDSNKTGFENMATTLTDSFKNQLEEILKPIQNKVVEIENSTSGSKAIEGQDYVANTATPVIENSDDMWNGFFKNAVPKDILLERKYAESEEE